MNHHMRHFNKMFLVGCEHDHEDRVTKATVSTNVPSPPMYGLRKDHKEHEDRVKGPPVRPVCGASEAPNSRFSNFLSRIINDYADSTEIKTECKSSEEMRAAFEEFNSTDQENRKRCKIISMDVKALFPSMNWDEIVQAVRDMIENSEKQIEKVDWKEVGKYLAVSLTQEEIIKEGLQHVVPKRINETNREISVAYLSNKANEENWARARMPGNKQKKKMLGLTVALGVKACMENHTYKIGNRTYLQQEGGPIGLELTGAASRAFMWRWDKMYLEKARKAGVEIMMYERYVDDSNQVAVVPERGAKYDAARRKVIVDQRSNESEKEEEDDERLARVLRDIANDVMECIKMEADWPTKNPKKKLPILDMEVWMENGTILYSHYEKPMSCKSVIHNKSAHPAICKRGVHTQEILRRIMNCSSRLNWEKETAPFLTEYMLRMKKAEYKETYRKAVLTNALKIHEKKLADEKDGTRPMFRSKHWKKEERKEEKEIKKKNWATKRGHIAPIFVPATPGGELARRMKTIADREAKAGIHFNIIEIGGRTLKSEVQKSNPTATPGCDKTDCVACSLGRGKGGNCQKGNVNYKMECMECPESTRATYIGETSKNLYTRAAQHIGNREQEESFIKKHEVESHNGETVQWKASVTHTNRECLSRQVREGVQIRRNPKPSLNSKTEWFQPPLYKIMKEVVRE